MTDDLKERLTRVFDWLRIATDDTNGRDESDPVYKAITENRDSGEAYSSCGDLCHWLLYRLGIRSKYINRAEHLGWRTGMNIGYLMWKCPEARTPRHDEQLQAGDIVAIWNRPDGFDAHVLVVRQHQGTLVASSDYGQPGGKMRTRVLDRFGKLGDRKFQRVVPVNAALEGARQRGELVAADDPLGWLAQLSGSDLKKAEPPDLFPGDGGQYRSGLWVERMQKILNSKSDEGRLWPLVVVDGARVRGAFGPKTEFSLRCFQQHSGLRPTGVCDSATWKELGQ